MSSPSVGPRFPHVTKLFAVGLVALMAGTLLTTGLVSLGQRVQAGPAAVRPEVPVTPMDLRAAASSNSPKLAQDPTDDNFVVMANRLDAPDFSCALQVSGDGGSSWLSAQPVPVLPPGAEKCYAAEVAFDRSGTLQFLFVGLEGAGNQPMGAFLTSSTDRGVTFSPPRQVLGPLNFGVRMAIDATRDGDNRMHLVWLQATTDPPLGGFSPPPNPIMAAYSDDGGATFSAAVQVSDPDRELVVAPVLALGPDRRVHVGYYDLGDDVIDYRGLEGDTWSGTWSVVTSTSLDGGGSYDPGVVVDDDVLPPGRVMLIFTMPPPALAAGPERLCAAWTDARYGDADALTRCSRTGGASWQELQRLNDDPVGNGRDQYLPALAASPDGRIDAIFYDRRADPDNLRSDVSFTSSAGDRGRFGPNVRLTRDPSDSRIGQRYVNVSAQGQVEFGARLGLLSGADRAVAAWPDTRNADAGTTGQDLFSTVIDLPPGDRPRWPRVLGAALTAAGLVGVAASGAFLRIRRQRK